MIATLMRSLQYDFFKSSCKSNSITHLAAAPSNLDAATTMRSAEAELQHTLEQNNAWTARSPARPIRERSRCKRTCSATARRTSFPIHLPGHILSCKKKHFVHPLTLKNAFRARLPSKTESGRCENEAFLRDLPQKVSWRCKTKLSCQPSLKEWKWKMWTRSFRYSGDIMIVVILW